MRLTEKLNSGGYIIDTKLDYADSVVEMIQKYGQLEDIEDELGIDLITFWKLIKDRFVYVKMPFSKKIIKTIASDIYEDWFTALVSGTFDDDEIGEIPESCFTYITLKYEDYGKTWALTKEELL